MTALETYIDHKKLINWLSNIYFMTPTHQDLTGLDLLSLDISDLDHEELVALDTLIANMDQAAVKEVAVDYTSLFCGFRNDAPFPYESIYRGEKRLLVQEPCSEVKAAYAEDGYEPEQAGGNEPADHLSFELQYLSYLLDNATEALKNGEEEKALSYLEKKNLFLSEHLERWVPHFCEEVKEQSDTEFFKLTSALTERAVTAVAKL